MKGFERKKKAPCSANIFLDIRSGAAYHPRIRLLSVELAI
jgi:hypothetical protein